MKNKNHIRIYSQELVLEDRIYLAITEIRTIDCEPLRTFYYELPNRFKYEKLMYKEEEHFYPLSFTN